MRRLLYVTVCCAVVLAGCASPTIDAWADRGLQGVANARANTLALRDEIRQRMRLQQASDLDTIFNDVLRAGTGKLLDPNGKPIPIDAAWVEEHKLGFKATMVTWQAQREALDDATSTALQNLDSTAEAFHQIKRLRRSWGTSSEVEARLARLSSLVEAMLAERRTK